MEIIVLVLRKSNPNIPQSYARKRFVGKGISLELKIGKFELKIKSLETNSSTESPLM